MEARPAPQTAALRLPLARLKPPLTYGDVRRVLHLLDPLLAERRIILVGGQAVAFWARYLAPRSLELAAADALTSKDIDFEGSAQSVTRAANLLSGRPKIATMDDHTPNTGIVLFTDSTGTPREIDFIDASDCVVYHALRRVDETSLHGSWKGGRAVE